MTVPYEPIHFGVGFLDGKLYSYQERNSYRTNKYLDYSGVLTIAEPGKKKLRKLVFEDGFLQSSGDPQADALWAEARGN